MFYYNAGVKARFAADYFLIFRTERYWNELSFEIQTKANESHTCFVAGIDRRSKDKGAARPRQAAVMA
jgi:hypothetical protein